MTTLYSFCHLANCADGQQPSAGLIQATDGNFYGSTLFGGTGCSGLGCGTVFRMTPQGKLTVLHSFNCLDGAEPSGTLVQGFDGNMYGTTEGGGTTTGCQNGGGYGTVFKIASFGAFTTLHSFSISDGDYPHGALIQAVDGNLYGTTEFGGLPGDCGGVGQTCGTIFRLSATDQLTTLYDFCQETGCLDGYVPVSGLISGTDGNLYGTTEAGGGSTACPSSLGCGTLFYMSPTGTPITLHAFELSDGANPVAALLQSTDGKFYGTTSAGTIYGWGTIFSLDMGLGPFVAFVRNPTKVGQMFGVLGQGFTGTTNVSLNGTSISFTVKSDTLITATVPAGGTTGPVTVTTPTGTLTSNVPFRVLPQLLSFTPTSGPVGTQVTITGVSLTQTTGVGFGDYTPAQFTVNSDTQVTATVPSGAKTGPVGIQTQGGIAISTQVFTVTQ